MANFTQNNIAFKANKVDYGKSGMFGNADNDDFSDAEQFGVTPFVNAVEIDWNSAIIGEG